MKRRASTQAAHVGLRSIQDGVATLRDGQARAVLEVSSVNFGLIGAGEQEAVVASFAAMLNGLTFAVQVLVRVLPVDLERYVADPADHDQPAQEALGELIRIADDIAAIRRHSGMTAATVVT